MKYNEEIAKGICIKNNIPDSIRWAWKNKGNIPDKYLSGKYNRPDTILPLNDPRLIFLRKVLDNKTIKAQNICKNIGLRKQFLSHAIRNRQKVSIQNVELLLNAIRGIVEEVHAIIGLLSGKKEISERAIIRFRDFYRRNEINESGLIPDKLICAILSRWKFEHIYFPEKHALYIYGRLQVFVIQHTFSEPSKKTNQISGKAEYDQALADKLAKKHSLPKTTTKAWRIAGKIPEKYLLDTFVPPEKIKKGKDFQLYERIVSVLRAKKIKLAGLCALAGIPYSHMDDVLNKDYMPSVQTLKKLKTAISICSCLVVEVVEIFELPYEEIPEIGIEKLRQVFESPVLNREKIISSEKRLSRLNSWHAGGRSFPVLDLPDLLIDLRQLINDIEI